MQSEGQTHGAEASGAGIDVRSLIAGRWVAEGGDVIETVSLATGEPAGRVRQCSAGQVDVAVAAARAAQRAWREASIATRTEPLMRVHALLDERKTELAHAITADMGKTLRHSLEEVDGARLTIEEGVADVRRNFGEIPPSTSATPTAAARVSKRVLVTHVPVGVVSIITTWNFPVAIAAEQLASALGFGNTVVWKPSEVAPTSSHLVAEILLDAGFPAGVVNVLHGAGEIGARMVAHPDVDMVSFVGSIETGERIARAAGIKQLLLELGGNGPLVVMDDADLDAAVEATISSAFYIGGQVCTAAERVLVQSSVHDEFVAKLLQRTSEIKAGDPLDDQSYLGPMATESAIEKTTAHVRDAVTRGARVVAGGSADGRYFPPTVLVDVDPAMEIAQEETFGPVAPIIRFASREQALEIANGTRYGLQAAVFTSSLESAWYMAEGLECGTVHINEGTNHWELLAPFGGVKQSGVGRILGSRSAFTRPKQITFEPSPMSGTDQDAREG